MKKKLLFLSTLTLICILASCSSSGEKDSSSIKNTSSINNVLEKEFYLTGDLDLNGEEKVNLLKNGSTYTYSNVKLKRGNSFLIYSNDNQKISYDFINDTLSFAKGENDYIRVINEGLYNITLEDSTTPSLKLDKINSSYSEVNLVFDDGKKIPFSKNSDFTFSLNDVELIYRDKFYIELDDEKLTYDALDYNNVYYEALVFSPNYVDVKMKGTFSFKIDFSALKPLICTSDLFKAPQELPFDSESYRDFIANISKQFNEEGSLFDLEETKTNEQETTKKYYKESINLNEWYYEEIQSEDEDATKLKRSKVLTEDNFFDIITYENSTLTPSVKGYILGEAPDKVEDNDSSIVTVEKEYISVDKAKEQILNSTGKEYTIKNYFNNVLNRNHLLANEKIGITDQEYLDGLKLKASYLSNKGDALSIEAINVEKYVNGKNSKAFLNKVFFKTDNYGHVEEGYVLLESFSGDIFDENKELLDSLAPKETTLYSFTYEYNKREKVKEFILDPEKYVANEITCLPEIDIDAGDSLSSDKFVVLDCEPNTAIDRNNYQVIQYDSNYISKIYSGYQANKIGSTTIVLGTTYNDVTATINVYINYKSKGYPSLSISSNDSIYYEGETYEFRCSITNYYDPYVSVSISDEEYVELISIDDVKTQRQQNVASFKLKMKKATTSSITITAKSEVYANRIATKSITIKESFKVADFAEKYYLGAENKFLLLNNDGTGELNVVEDKYAFTWTIKGNKLTLLNSDSLSELTGEFAEVLRTQNILKLTNIVVKDKDGNVIKVNDSTSLNGHVHWDKFENYKNMQTEDGNATLELVGYINPTTSYEYSSAKFKIVHNDDVYEFTWKAPASAYNYFNGQITNIILNGVAKSYFYTFEVTVLEEETITFNIKESYSSTLLSLTFFVK